jgi:hypothetical protein
MFKVSKGLEAGFQVVLEVLQGQWYMVVRQKTWEQEVLEMRIVL